MKLWYSTTSPFVRKVMVVIKHHQLDNQIELLRVTSAFDPNAPHNRDNPLGRIPALQLDNGEWLFGSLLISEYLDCIGRNNRLLPQGEHRWQILQVHSLVDGILENTIPMVAERMLRPQEAWWRTRHEQITERNRRSFIELEKYLAKFDEHLNIGTLSAVCLIDWWAFRQAQTGVNLSETAPNLTAWAARMNARYDLLAETKPK